MKEFRNQLQLTQRELAALIGVSFSVICLSEKGLRSLPAAAAIKLTQLQAAWQQYRLHKKPLFLKTNAAQLRRNQEGQNQLNARLLKAAAGSVRISQQLTAMRLRHQLLNAKLGFVQALLQAADTQGYPEIVLRNMEQSTMRSMACCCPSRQRLTRFKFRLYAAIQDAIKAGMAMLWWLGATVNPF